MKQIYKLLSLLLCLALLLSFAGCKSDTDTDTTVDTSETPTQPTQTQAPIEATPAEHYAEAVEALLAEDALHLTYSVADVRNIGSEEFTQMVDTEIDLKGLQGELLAEKSGQVTFNEDEPLDYEEQYKDGMIYSHFGEIYSKQEANAEDYLAARYPISLIDPACYATVTAEETAEGMRYHFADATALEAWLGNEYATLISAEATALVTEDGISQIRYVAAFTQGAATVSYDITADITVGTDCAFNAAPVEDSDYMAVTNVLIPWAFEWAVSNIFNSYNLTANIQQLIQSEATGVMTFETEINACHAGNYIADIQHDVAFYSADTSTTYSAQEHLEDGTYTYTVNGEVQAEESMADYQFQNGIAYMLDQYIVLSSWITSTALTEHDGLWIIDFSSADAECGDYIKYCTSNEIYGSSTTLDDIATSYVTNDVSGTLSVDMDTMLPTAYSLNYSGTHNIENADYVLSQTYLLSITPASTAAYYNITSSHISEEEPAERATPLFYHVTDANGNEMWLLGTIHLGDARTAYLPQEIYDAFDASDALAVEVNLNNVTDESYTTEMINAYFYSDAATISEHIDPALYETATVALRGAGSYSEQMEYMKASLWENMISQAYVGRYRMLDSSKGVDQRLLDRAEAVGKEILEVESFEDQFYLLLNYSDALQELLLDETVSTGYYAYIDSVAELYALWCSGDEAAITEYLSEDDTDLTEEEQALYAEYEKAMETDRNAGMLEVAKEYLQSGKTVFYAVGLAHLLGETGLIECLRAAGYTVELVPYAAS